MSDEDLLILGQTEHLQPDAHFIHTPRIHCSHNTHVCYTHARSLDEVRGQRSGHTWHVERGARLLVFVVFVFLEFGHEAEFSATTALGEIGQLTLHTNTH